MEPTASSTNTSTNALHENEMIDTTTVTITESPADFNQNLHTPHEEATTESLSTAQGDQKGKRKFKRKFISDDIREPKEKVSKIAVKLTAKDEELHCKLCTELFIEAVTLTCSHTFCKYCIDHWRRRQTGCPICQVKIVSVSPTLIIDNLIEKIINNCSDEVKERRAKIIKERTTAATTAIDVDYNRLDDYIEYELPADLRCRLCLELFIETVTLTCCHMFCKYCIDHWRMVEAHCPICRIQIDSVSPNLSIDNLIRDIIDKCRLEVKERRAQIVYERSLLYVVDLPDLQEGSED